MPSFFLTKKKPTLTGGRRRTYSRTLMFHSHTSPLLHVLAWIDYRGGWMGAGRPVTDRWHNCRDGAGEEREPTVWKRPLRGRGKPPEQLRDLRRVERKQRLTARAEGQNVNNVSGMQCSKRLQSHSCLVFWPNRTGEDKMARLATIQT